MVGSPGAFSVEMVEFAEHEAAIRAVREAVFVVEQAVPVELEWDGIDAACRHVLAWDDARRPIGTGRLTPDRHIGRMAVLPPWRGRGVGSAILAALVAAARERGWDEVALNAQTQAMPFYARFGFVAAGDEFTEAGIPHRRMVANLQAGR